MIIRTIGRQNKKGFLRIFEAFVAVMIIAGAMGYIYFQKFKGPSQEDIALGYIELALDEIQNNISLREAVVSVNPTDLKYVSDCGISHPVLCPAIYDIIPDRQYDFAFKICELNTLCRIDSEGREIYSDEISVSSTLTTAPNPKKIRIFVWEKVEGD